MATKRIQKSYDNEYKAQAVKLAQEIGGHKAANELGIPSRRNIVCRMWEMCKVLSGRLY